MDEHALGAARSGRIEVKTRKFISKTRLPRRIWCCECRCTRINVASVAADQVVVLSLDFLIIDRILICRVAAQSARYNFRASWRVHSLSHREISVWPKLTGSETVNSRYWCHNRCFQRIKVEEAMACGQDASNDASRHQQDVSHHRTGARLGGLCGK